jgi:hypothetical protein
VSSTTCRKFDTLRSALDRVVDHSVAAKQMLHTNEMPSSSTKHYRKFAVYAANTTSAAARSRTGSGSPWRRLLTRFRGHEAATSFVNLIGEEQRATVPPPPAPSPARNPTALRRYYCGLGRAPIQTFR